MKTPCFPKTPMLIAASGLIASLLCPTLANAAPGGYRQEEVRAFKVNPSQKAIVLEGFNMHKQTTMKKCVKPKTGKVKTKKVAGKPAVSRFDYVHTVQEAYEREGIDVAVQASVSYGIAGASVDVRHEGFQEASNSSTNGSIHGYYENEHEVKWVTSDLVLTPEAQALHDKAMITGNWKKFEKQCGQGVIIATQHGDFFSVMASLRMSNSMSASEKKTAVKAGVEIAKMVKANVSVSKLKKEMKKLGSTEVNVHATWSGKPKLKNPKSLESARQAFHEFPTKKNITDMIGFRVVPYKEAVSGFGTLDGHDALSPKRRKKVTTILNGLAYYERAISETDLSSDKFAKTARAYLKQDYKRARKAFKNQKGCLRGEWSLVCEDLRAKFAPFGKPTGSKVKKMVSKMLGQGKTCAKYTPEMAVLNPKGYMTCLKCSMGKYPVFANGKNGKCGRLDPKKAKGSVRLGLGDLDDPKKISYEAGVYGTDYRRPDICKSPGKGCNKPRADQLCKERGFAGSTYFDVIKTPETRYANGKKCIQSKENTKPVPNKCRTPVVLDCACKKGKKPKGKKCK